MSQHMLASNGVPETEYSVYVYLYSEDIEHGHTDWEMKVVTGCVQDAVNQAQALFDSRDFKKVEVKKKFFDVKYGRVVDATYKVLQDKRKKPSRRSSVMALLGLSCFAGITLLAVPFLT